MLVHDLAQAGHKGVHGRIRPHFRCVKEQFLAPHQPSVLAPFHHLRKELSKDRQPQPLTDTREARVVG
ncbi:MAG TPA: hypothetical protein VGW38_25580 [Chloroflexota bacterium]|nr:hypothetical protein [Chloroflexota bacterium]